MFEPHTCRSIHFQQQHTVPKHAVHQIWRGSVQDHQIHRLTELRLDRSRDVQAQTVQRSRRVSLKEDGHIDITGHFGIATSLATEQIGTHELPSKGGQARIDTVKELLIHHFSIIDRTGHPCKQPRNGIRRQ